MSNKTKPQRALRGENLSHLEKEIWVSRLRKTDFHFTKSDDILPRNASRPQLRSRPRPDDLKA